MNLVIFPEINIKQGILSMNMIYESIHYSLRIFLDIFISMTFFSGIIQDCGAKTDALGEWQGSTKFGGERLGESSPGESELEIFHRDIH